MGYLKQINSVYGYILLGFLLFGLRSFAKLFFHPLQMVFALLGLILIFFSPFIFKFKAINPLQGIVQIVFYLYLAWTFIIISRPIIEGQNYNSFSIHPYFPYGLYSYLLPLIVLLGVGIISLPKLFRIVYIFAIIGFIYFILNYRNMQAIVEEGILNAGPDSDSPGINALANMYGFWFNISAFSLLCYEFISKKQKWLAILSNAFMLFLCLYFARRGGIVIIFLYFIAAFYLYLQQSNGATKFMKALFMLLIIGTISFTVFMYSDTTFSLLFSRIDEDTRSGVDESLIRYLDSEDAWFFGKGIDGVYTHSSFDQPRYDHETGYLYMILKGGIVYLSLYVFLLLHSAYVGFFQTNNRLTKAFAIYLLMHVFLLVPFGLITFDLEYLFVWIAVASTQYSKFRLMTNEQMKQYLALTN